MLETRGDQSWPGHLWSPGLRHSPAPRSGGSPGPAPRRSSRDTPSPGRCGTGRPRSSSRPRPGLCAPSRTRTGLWLVKGPTCRNADTWRLFGGRIRLCWTEETGTWPPSRWRRVRRSPPRRALTHKLRKLSTPLPWQPKYPKFNTNTIQRRYESVAPSRETIIHQLQTRVFTRYNKSNIFQRLSSAPKAMTSRQSSQHDRFPRATTQATPAGWRIR